VPQLKKIEEAFRNFCFVLSSHKIVWTFTIFSFTKQIPS